MHNSKFLTKFSRKVGGNSKNFQKMAKFPLKFSKSAGFHWFFDLDFFIISLASGGGCSATRTPRKCTFLIFRNFCSKFREKFEKILKNLEKIANFLSKLSKICKIFIDFKKKVKLLLRRRSFLPRPTRRHPWWTSIPPKKFLLALMMINQELTKLYLHCEFFDNHKVFSFFSSRMHLHISTCMHETPSQLEC